MKISAVKSFNNINSLKQANDVKSEQKVQNNVSVPIISNSLSEAIGRSQVVSFSGENRFNGPVFEHYCSETFGDKENILYDKRNGSFTHEVFDRKGVLKDKQEFYPAIGKEIITRVRNGITTVSTKIPSGTIIEKLDEQGRQIILDTCVTDGGRTLIETEYDKNRKIVTKEFNGDSSVQVFDLRTRMPVTSGALVVKDYYDEKTDTYYSKNLITGQILKVEKYRPNGSLFSSVEYSESTGKAVKEVLFDSRTGGYRETIYNDAGFRTSLKLTSKDSRFVELFDYQDGGRTIVRHTSSEYDKKGLLILETEYSPITGAIDTETEYDKDGCTIYYYKKSTGKTATAEKYVDGFLAEEIKFRQDGKTYAYLKENKKDGSYSETLYDELGFAKIFKKCSADNFMYYAAEYDTITNIKIREKEYDRQYGDSKESFYDNENGRLTKMIKRDSRGNLVRVVNYYEDGQTQQSRQDYNKDGSFTYTVFDRDGRIISENEYNADGTKKQMYRGKHTENAQRTEYSRSSRKKPDVEEILNHISWVLNIKNSEDGGKEKISEYEWKVLSAVLETGEDTELIKNMDKATYRKLALKYHPDVHRDVSEEDLKAYELIFRIVSSLWQQSSKNC